MSSIEGNSHWPRLLARCRSLFLWCSISDLCLSATCRNERQKQVVDDVTQTSTSSCWFDAHHPTSVLTFSVRVGLGWDGACGGLGRGCMAISCTLLAWRRVPSDEPRDRRSTWSKMEDEERSSSGVLPDGTKGQTVTVLKLNRTGPDLYIDQSRKWKHTHLVPPFNYEALRREQLLRITHHTHTTHSSPNDVTVSLTIFGRLPVLFPLAGCGHRPRAFLS